MVHGHTTPMEVLAWVAIGSYTLGCLVFIVALCLYILHKH